jgi:hypothetical protein
MIDSKKPTTEASAEEKLAAKTPRKLVIKTGVRAGDEAPKEIYKARH